MKASLSLLASSWLLCLGSGCGPELRPDLDRHVIAIDAEGDLTSPFTGRKIDPEKKDRLPGDPDDPESEYFSRLLVEADRVADAMGVGQRRIMIHVHGGLNGRNASLKSAQDVIERLEIERRKRPGDWYYPIFVTWPSGGLSTYRDHLCFFRHGSIDEQLGPPTAPLFLLTDITRGLVRSPRSTSLQLTNDLAHGVKAGFDRNLLPSWKDTDALYCWARQPRDGSPHQPMYHVGRGIYGRGFGVQGFRLFCYTVTLPLKFVTQVLVLDSMGQGAWEVMLHRIRNLFWKESQFEISGGGRHDRFKMHSHLGQREKGALAKFLAVFREHLNSQKGRADYEIVLVGHSMGAIVMNEALEYFEKGEVAHIVYMAPACTVQDAVDKVVPFLLIDEETRFHVLTLHPSAELEEINYGDLIHRGSLLEWIDSWYTTPQSPPHQRLGRWVSLIRSLHLFHDVRDRMSVKAFGVEPGSIPSKHGDFNDCPFWRSDFRDETQWFTWTPWDDETEDWEPGSRSDRDDEWCSDWVNPAEP